MSTRGGVHPLWTELLTHACENITFAQFRLQTVTRMHSSMMRITHRSSHLRGGCLPQCMLGYTPQAWAWTPLLGVGRTPPHVGLDTHPQVWAWTPLGLHLDTTSSQTPRPPPGPGPRHLPPLWTEFLTHASENITLPQLR